MFRLDFALPLLCASIALAGTVEDLGIPIKAVVFGNSHGVLARGPRGTPDMFYISYYSTTGSQLIGYHAATGEKVALPVGSAGGYGLTKGLDGALYLGGVGPGNLYRYRPGDQALESLGGAQFGVQYIWDAATAPDGKIYGACYPQANLIEFDPATGVLRDLGRLREDVQYVRSVCVDRLGRVWAGLGTRAHLIVYKPGDGSQREVLPEEYHGNSSVYSLQANGDYVFASVLYAGVLLVYRIDTCEVVRTLQHPPGDFMWMNCAGAPAGHAYLYGSPSGSLYDYDVEADKVTLLARNLGQCELVADGRFVHAINDQDYVLYDLQEKKALYRERLAEARDGMALFTLTSGPDGMIYGSTYINQHLFRCNPQTGDLTDLGKVIRGGGQVDSICCGRNGKIYIGAYARAILAVYDPSRPWQPGIAADSNPRERGPIGQGQYRTRCIVQGPDHNVYVGSIPSYNSGPTGAFSRWNTATDRVTVWTDLVPGGAVHHVAADDRYVYGAGGGLLFVFDPQTGKKVHEEQQPVSAMAVGPDKLLYLSLGDEIAVFSPTELNIVARFPCPAGALGWMILAPNGKLCGINGKTLVEIDPEARTATVLAAEGGKFLAADSDSNLYFARGSRLFRWRR